MSSASKSAYARAGVDIDEMMSAIGSVKQMVRRTSVKGVLSNVGSFGGLFALPGTRKVLVASTDGVGTKLKIAAMAKRHDSVGQDLVNHCVNDILVQGAKPLFFLDYLGAAKLKADVFKQVVAGLCKACRSNGCALLGGETAEMPGLYPKGEYDLVGTVVGIVERSDLVTGEAIRPGDRIIGLASSGLHTNGYSLARRIVFDKARLSLHHALPGTRKHVGNALLAVHRSYLKPVTRLMASVPVRGMAHITGGGFYDNIPRILPPKAHALIDRASWRVPPLFEFLQKRGHVDEKEMYRVFNMGIGYVIIVRPRQATKAMDILKRASCRAFEIGKIVEGRKGVSFSPGLS